MFPCLFRGGGGILTHEVLLCVGVEKPLLARGERLGAGQATKVRAGLGQNSADVAFASRSLMSGNVFSAVRKLDAAARSRAAVVVPDSLLPSRDPRLLTYLGRSARHPRVVRDVTRALASLGRIPVFATTRTFRPMRFSSFDEARVDLRRLAGPEPFTAREQRLFDAYAAQHVVREDLTGPSEVAEEHWVLDYRLPVTWAFIGWSTDGSEWA